MEVTARVHNCRIGWILLFRPRRRQRSGVVGQHFFQTVGRHASSRQSDLGPIGEGSFENNCWKIVKANVLANVDKSHKSSIDLSICMTNAIHYC